MRNLHGFWRRYRLPLQVALTIGLMTLLVMGIDLGELLEVIIGLRLEALIIGFNLMILSHGFNVLRWRLLLDKPQVRLGDLIVYYGAGLFSSNFVPTGLGGDGVRTVLLSRHVKLGRALFSVAAERILGFVGLLVLLAGWLVSVPPNVWQEPVKWIRLNQIIGRQPLAVLAGGLGLAAGGSLLVYTLRTRQFPLGRLLRGWLVRGDVPLWNRAQWVRQLSIGLLLSLISQLSLALATLMVLQAAGISVSFGVAISLVVLGSFSLLVPIAFNGLGLVEGIFVWVLGLVGIDPVVALSVALVSRGLGILISLIGGTVSLRAGISGIDRSYQDEQRPSAVK